MDDRITVKTPLRKPGAYLVHAKMADGNTSRIIVWISDTVIIKKQLAGQAYYDVADAVTGQPVPKASVEFFGWKQEQVQPNVNQFRVVTTQFQATTDADGQLILALTSSRSTTNGSSLPAKPKRTAPAASRISALPASGTTRATIRNTIRRAFWPSRIGRFIGRSKPRISRSGSAMPSTIRPTRRRSRAKHSRSSLPIPRAKRCWRNP